MKLGFRLVVLLAAAALAVACSSPSEGGGGDKGTEDTGGAAEDATKVAEDSAAQDISVDDDADDEPMDVPAPVDLGPPQPVCEPGEVSCEGKKVQACQATGLAWYTVEECEGSLFCNPETASCQAECVPLCGGKQCGPDFCGGSCGDCPDGIVCDPFGRCDHECLEKGTGKNPGHYVANATWKDLEGNQVDLHGYCSKTKAIFIMETATW